MPSKAPQPIYQLKITLTSITLRSVTEVPRITLRYIKCLRIVVVIATMLVMRPEKKKAEGGTVAEQ